MLPLLLLMVPAAQGSVSPPATSAPATTQPAPIPVEDRAPARLSDPRATLRLLGKEPAAARQAHASRGRDTAGKAGADDRPAPLEVYDAVVPEN